MKLRDRLIWNERRSIGISDRSNHSIYVTDIFFDYRRQSFEMIVYDRVDQCPKILILNQENEQSSFVSSLLDPEKIIILGSLHDSIFRHFEDNINEILDEEYGE